MSDEYACRFCDAKDAEIERLKALDATNKNLNERLQSVIATLEIHRDSEMRLRSERDRYKEVRDNLWQRVRDAYSAELADEWARGGKGG